MYETHWTGLFRTPWEQEMDLQLSRQQILLYWAGTPKQHRQTNRLYRQMRNRAAQRELPRANGWVPRLTGYAATAPRCSPMGAIFGKNSSTAGGGQGKSALVLPPTGNFCYVF